MTSVQWGLVMASPLVLGFLAIMWQVRKLVHTVVRVRIGEARREEVPGE